jgi:enolase-phosphatase E1
LAAPVDDTAVRAILLDIEGTTTPIDFVYRTLFPYARLRVAQFLLDHASEPGIRKDLEDLRAQHRADLDERLSPPPWLDEMHGLDLAAVTSYVLELMDRDSKCPALKSLQGKIWQEGYRKGELHGEVYPDVPLALERWSQQGKIVAIYSSGSVLAQKLLFGSTAAGDLTRFLRAYFDTAIGPKHLPESYARIAAALALAPPNILFISDVAKELDAARAEGIQTALCVRTPPNERIASTHNVIHSFEELFLI